MHVIIIAGIRGNHLDFRSFTSCSANQSSRSLLLTDKGIRPPNGRNSMLFWSNKSSESFKSWFTSLTSVSVLFGNPAIYKKINGSAISYQYVHNMWTHFMHFLVDTWHWTSSRYKTRALLDSETRQEEKTIAHFFWFLHIPPSCFPRVHKKSSQTHDRTHMQSQIAEDKSLH